MVSVPLSRCSDGLEDLEGVGGKFMSPAHLFRQGTQLIFASLLEGNESTDWPKVTWVSRELLLSGFDHFVQFHLHHATLEIGSLSL